MVGPDSSDHVRDSSKILGRSAGANDGLELRQGPWSLSHDTYPLTQVHSSLLFDPCDDRFPFFEVCILERDMCGKGFPGLLPDHVTDIGPGSPHVTLSEFLRRPSPPW
ncbi:unnamed protein product [Aspergillus oryzae RIB40]|uniref:DNA, SC023 n=2 Tax=Aspergillus oryzae TaxID=5062 RepID=Q2UH39_ASPOR|nr:unnamed protein product [Aspergillus oryzae RIB40]EIT75208.1 hypothetical protein Ao3042_09135 [Aspergillus oryzae 3.042]KDE85011.1 hypothetical protein AO1008_00367 [Aspergillus oryzae 100-8]KOC09196.1 hypothetical protein AFLA70_77g002960 [Aspergillus flavus AF70]BAE59126.1 unnamed protein product [Aspergillus oryzae RIB40]|eukprot:EIT75208.1 hypothetical protein Ao3042_09135 [Aspergillus oryzae 3.042]